MADLSVLTEYVPDMRAILQEGTIAEQKAFVTKFVKEIVVKGQEFAIRYTIPMPSNSSDRKRASVLDSIQVGCPAWIRTRDFSSKG